MSMNHGVPPRLTDYPFPPYSYVTGHHPHPLRDAAGHGCLGPPEPSQPLSDTHWRTSPMYLWAIDLFNAGYYWEAHEAWEAEWHGVGRSGPIADLLKALIKLAAAGVKARENRPEGVRRHCLRAEQLLSHLPADPLRPLCGMSIAKLREMARSIAADREATAHRASNEIAACLLPALQTTEEPSS